ncbi:guanine nucleotide binding protein, alpha subunit [Mycena sp. CBHHK59/15]|nr:guanine nucleotide binding protein, alpha subunit [Mycena sp. CBHHK59/15]
METGTSRTISQEYWYPDPLLGSSDSGKSTILKQLRLIYDAPFSSHETEIYRQLVFSNLMRELRFVLDSLAGMDFALPDALLPQARLLEENHDLRDNDRFPERYLSPLTSLWNNPVIQSAVIRGNEIALEENMQYFFSSLPRLFLPSYVPSHQDILHGRARTTGIVETIFKAKELEMLVVDVGGTKSERRKWIHCFNDVTVIMFVVSLSGYDKRLIEDFDDNQMRDSMLIWDSITASRWFNEQTTFILCLNKNDLFERKVPVSDIKDFFPEFNGEPGDALSGRDYFKARFRHLAEKNGRSIYIHVITATDTVAMRALMAGLVFVFRAILRSNLQGVAPI